MNKLKNLVAKVVASPSVVKAAHTFWQAFLAALLVSNFQVSKTIVLAAVAAGLSAVKSSVVNKVQG